VTRSTIDDRKADNLSRRQPDRDGWQQVSPVRGDDPLAPGTWLKRLDGRNGTRVITKGLWRDTKRAKETAPHSLTTNETGFASNFFDW
jgi:hypothetical protein